MPPPAGLPNRSVSAVRKPVDVIFIAGTGRSGSTILDRLLGQSPDVVSVGEFRSFWSRFPGGRPCSCGEPLQSCPFWSAVVRRAFGSVEKLPAAAVWRTHVWFRRLYFPFLILPIKLPAFLRRFGDAQFRLLAAVREESGAGFIVDSSKTAARGALLASLPGVRLHTIHIVRDSRAVAFSWRRPTVRGQPMGTRSLARSAFHWLRGNVAPFLLRFRSSEYVRVRYEDLVAQPGRFVESYLRRLNLAPADLGPGPEFELATGHLAGGNPIRFEAGPVRIAEDDEWKEKMSRRDVLALTLLTWPLLLKFGYPLLPAQRRAAPVRESEAPSDQPASR